jgi:GT2 family glycosyltransferase
LFSKDKLVTIIVPALNGGENLLRLVQSALAQTYTRLEIVVDGGSTDGSIETLRRVRSEPKGLRILEEASFSSSRGPANARNLPDSNRVDALHDSEARTSAHPRVSVIVLNYNGESVIERCLRSVVRQEYSNFETIVVDNCSSDNSVKIIQSLIPRVRLIENRRNLGYTGALNAAVLQTSKYSELLAIVTDDVVLSTDWLQRMVEVVDSDVFVGAVSSRVYELSRQATMTELRIIYPSGTLYVPWNKDVGIQEVSSPSGPAFVVRKHVFRSVGGFDPDYFAYYDEVDLGWRIRLLGYKVVYNPHANVIHEGSHSFGKLPVFLPTLLSERNRMLACMKNLGPTSIAAFILAEAFNLAYRAFRGLFSSRWRPIDRGYALAFFGFVCRARRALGRRTSVQRSRRRTDQEIFSASPPRIMEPLSRKELVFRCVLEFISRAFPAR